MSWVSRTSRLVMPFGIPLRSEFPPRHLQKSEPLDNLAISDLEKRTKRLKKLENIYHKGQAMAWNGKEVLAELVDKHGGIQINREQREALAGIFSIILWGELGAWEVASYLAEHIRDHTEAKMAATIQTFDEARHYYVMRDYLELLEVEVPPPNAFVKTMLSQLLTTDSMLLKLIGMQLFVEHVAIHLFRSLSELQIEPILTDLLRYFHRDEARHIALGRLYLPELLSKISRRESMSLQAYQIWLVAFMQLAIEYHKADADVLGLDIQKTMIRALREQAEMLDDIKRHEGVRGVWAVPKRLRFVTKWLINNIWTPPGEVGEGLLSTPRRTAARQRVVLAAERMWGKVA